MIPGLNIFKLAATRIATDTVIWRPFVSRERNALGNWEVTYGDPIQIKGSVQPVEGREYQALGLDMNKRYVTLFTAHDFKEVNRQAAPDKLIWDGGLWEPVGGDNWSKQDGWRDGILVYLGPEEDPQNE